METLIFDQQASRAARYEVVLGYVEALLLQERDWVAALANTVAVLREGLGFFWIGFYRVCGQELVLGPFQGPVACVRIAYGKGVCGAAWQSAHTQLVPDVHAFAGHIACNAASQSEIVVPILINGAVRLVLDIDSNQVNDFSHIDQEALERLAKMLAQTPCWAQM